MCASSWASSCPWASLPAPAGRLGPSATPHPMTQQKVKPESPCWLGRRAHWLPPCKTRVLGGCWGAGAQALHRLACWTSVPVAKGALVSPTLACQRPALLTSPLKKPRWPGRRVLGHMMPGWTQSRALGGCGARGASSAGEQGCVGPPYSGATQVCDS